MGIAFYWLATLDTHLSWSQRVPLFGALIVALACHYDLRRGFGC